MALTRKHLLAGWIVLPAIAFTLGWYLRPVPQSAGEKGTAESRKASRSGPGAGASVSGREGRHSHKKSGLASLGVEAGSIVGSATPLSSQDILQLGEKFRGTLDPIARRAAFEQLIRGMTVENALEIREQVAHLNHEDPAFRDFHYAWGKIGGVDAIMNGSKTDKPDMAATMAGWASAHPDKAKAWFNTLADHAKEGESNFATKAYLKHGLIQGLSDTDPRMAGSFIVDLMNSGDEDASRLMGMVTGKLLRTERPQDVALWAESLPEGHVREGTLGHIARDFTRRDPQAAAEWGAPYAATDEGFRVINQIGATLASQNPQSAINWLDTLPAGKGKAWGLGGAFYSWAAKSPEEAGNYIKDMPASPDRDSAISGFAIRIAHEDPHMGIEWANSASSPQARQEALVNTGRIFYNRNREAAQEWLSNSGLSPEAQQRITGKKKE